MYGYLSIRLYNPLQKLLTICYIILKKQSYSPIWASKSFILYVSFINLY